MRNILAVFAFSVLVGLLVYNAQRAGPEGAAPPAPASPIPRIESRVWPALGSPGPAPSPAAFTGRDLFAAP